MQLRPYQRDCVVAVYDHLRKRDDNPCAVLPTGSGKTPVMATICRDAVTRWGGRVLILAHVKELLEQTTRTLERIAPELSAGVYSAGLRRRDTSHPVIVAGIQSVYQRACELDAFDLILVDECHLLPPDGDGMYQSLLADAKKVNPSVRLIGLTATPFRLKSGMLCGPESPLNHVCYGASVKQLIHEGYLCPLVTKASRVKADTSALHVRGGEFIAGEVESLMDREDLVSAACAEIVAQTRDRKATLIFAAGVEHGRHIVRVLREQHGVECGFVCGETPPAERERILGRFRGQAWARQLQIDFGQQATEPLQYLCNVNVLTTGFDAPNIDCVALLRPTMSPGLYYQMVGRGLRLDSSKRNYLVLDFGGNVMRHGPIDAIQVAARSRGGGESPAKECPECQSVVAAGYAKCPDCGLAFPPPDRQAHEAKASTAGILSGQITDTRYEVRDVTYHVHTKRGADDDAPKTLRVDYRLGLDHWQSEWVCLEHGGYARQKALAWWRRRSPDPPPTTIERAIEIAEAGGLATTHEITVRSIAGEKYDRIVDYQLGPMPEAVGAGDNCCDPDEVPF